MSNAQSDVLALDEAEVSSFHWRIVVTAGMGFFTDAYDLFIIGVVTAILAPIWHLSIGQLALLNGVSLAAAAVGAVFFGTLSDKFGRKKLYGLEMSILFVGAVLSAFSPNFAILLIARVIVGLGIGGDYPTSAVVISENATRERRGFLVLLVFGMQALGLIVGPFLASALLSTHLSHDIIWRVLLGLGAIPAASVFYLRRTIKESPRYLLNKKSPIEVSRMVHDLVAKRKPRSKKRQPNSLLQPKWLKYLIGTAGAWFCLDVAFYGNGVSSVMIMHSISPHGDLLHHTMLSALIFLVCAVPGYFLAAKYVDRMGRKPLQFLGFSVMALAYLAMGCLPQVLAQLPLFLAIFGLSFFFVNFGPNATTFLIASEIYPSAVRAKAHGISAAIGKVGAFVGAFFLPLMLHKYGLSSTMTLMALVACLGILTTFLVPEMKGVSLEETESK